MINRELEDKGFIILKGLINSDGVRMGQKCYNGMKVHYGRLGEYVKLMFDSISDKIGERMLVVKYRASNNNNSTDAGTFHRDVHDYRKDRSRPSGIFTCLSYLDEATLEVIPGSHIKTPRCFFEADNLLDKAVQIRLTPGDILIMNAMTLHRGIFYDRRRNQQRRLLQCFDCMLEKNYDATANKVIHACCNDSCDQQFGSIMSILNSCRLTNFIINYISYFNAAYGYGKRFGLLKKMKMEDVEYISPEAVQNRYPADKNDWGESNMYIVVKKTRDLRPDQNADYIFYAYKLGILVDSTFFLLFILLIVLFWRRILNKQKSLV